MPPFIQQLIANPMEHAVSVTAPEKSGVYRLYVWAKDGKGHAATANYPFEVR